MSKAHSGPRCANTNTVQFCNTILKVALLTMCSELTLGGSCRQGMTDDSKSQAPEIDLTLPTLKFIAFVGFAKALSISNQVKPFWPHDIHMRFCNPVLSQIIGGQGTWLSY